MTCSPEGIFMMDYPFWRKGEPKEEGFYLTRWVGDGGTWIRVFQAVRDPDRKDRLIYMDNYSGSSALKLGLYSCHGTFTHHCEPTGANFEKAMQEIIQQHSRTDAKVLKKRND